MHMQLVPGQVSLPLAYKGIMLSLYYALSFSLPPSTYLSLPLSLPTSPISHTLCPPHSIFLFRRYERVEDRLYEITVGGYRRPKAPAMPSYQLITDSKTATNFHNVRQISATLISECTENRSFGVCRKAILQGIPVCVKE